MKDTQISLLTFIKLIICLIIIISSSIAIFPIKESYFNYKATQDLVYSKDYDEALRFLNDNFILNKNERIKYITKLKNNEINSEVENIDFK